MLIHACPKICLPLLLCTCSISEFPERPVSCLKYLKFLLRYHHILVIPIKIQVLKYIPLYESHKCSLHYHLSHSNCWLELKGREEHHPPPPAFSSSPCSAETFIPSLLTAPVLSEAALSWHYLLKLGRELNATSYLVPPFQSSPSILQKTFFWPG